MKLLVIDGNSIINRAFYGIRLMTTKDGYYTNAIFGFLKILLKLEEMCSPDAVAVAFDVHAPTFRHKMYDAYKAGRHATPPELLAQMPVLKEVLKLLGYTTVECEGWEADDILGTLANICRQNGDECFIATGDRDSLQLASGSVKVLLARTKMGQAVTDVYDEKAIMDEFGIEPLQLIQVKALQGDTSDNIPGVAGVGQKTALDLIQRFNTVDYIYDNIDNIDIKPGVRNKLKNDKDNAYLSLSLGEIKTDAPVDKNIKNYIKKDFNKQLAYNEFLKLELFSLMPKFNLDAVDNSTLSEIQKPRKINVSLCDNAQDVIDKIGKNDAYFYPIIIDNSVTDLLFSFDDEIVKIQRGTPQFDEFVLKFFNDETIKKYSYNTKYLHRLAIEYGIECQNICGDLMLSAYLLRPSDSNYSIEHLCLEYAVPMPKCDNDLGGNDDDAASASVIKELFSRTNDLLSQADEMSLLNDIELPLSRVLARMEMQGFTVDKNGIEAFSKMLGEKANLLTVKIYEQVGKEFNINSPKQLGIALFEDMGIPCKKKTKTGYSTSADVLDELKDEYPVINDILEYRSVTKLKSTFCDGLLKVICDDGKIHSSFNQVETRTGRISSLEPNLQNIPIRTELGRQMRKFFVGTGDNLLVDCDYSQIELRVLSDLANDETMINAFNNGDDIHTITASQVFNLPPEMITPQLRSRAKAVNFGIVYGIGAFSLAKDIDVSVKEAKEYIQNYLNTYSGVDKYMHEMIELAREKGYAKTLFNRRRYLPELTAKNKMMQAFGERVARNMPIQGTAADIIKIAMVRVDKRLTDENLNARLILQVHDELIVEAPQQEAQKVLEILTQEMENACKMKVLLRADGNIGKSWYDSH